MRHLFLVVLMLSAAAGFAGDKGIKCEAQSYSEQNDSIVAVCPPSLMFSPIRVKMTIEQIDRFGWSDVHLDQAAPIQVREVDSPVVYVLLPHQHGTRRWLAWRKFKKIATVIITEQR